jgi:transposase
VVIEPEEVKAEPDAYERIGEERTFEVEITPPQLSKREIVRPKYKAKADRAQPPVLAPAPPRAMPGGYASAGLLAWVVIAKYLDHRVPRAKDWTMTPVPCATAPPMRD